jgi:tRNA A37 methylthiotransferase MiaB
VRAAGGKALVALVGVQSNQFPHAMDIARPFRAAGIPVCIGGFHVSGCLSMLPEIQPDLQEALDLGVSLFAGEIEGRMDQLLRDAYSDELKPIYNFLNELPNLGGVPVPYLPIEHLPQLSSQTSFDAGRGCPFNCSFCTIINVQGRKSRYRTADDIERIVRANVEQGINYFFITDDNFARNGDWEEIFDRLIRLRKRERIRIRLSIQVDTACHRIPNFIMKAAGAGVVMVFIGLENINPDTLKSTQKGQNLISEYHNMLQAWHRVRVVTTGGYILGFPNDTRESVLRDIEIIKSELPIDMLHFFILTPLPGSVDHQRLYQAKVPMDSDMNRFDSWHVVTDHRVMSREELQQVYNDVWDVYYSAEHVETVMRRSMSWADPGIRRFLLGRLLYFAASAQVEKVHPLEGGRIRRKYRRDRRPGMPLENPLIFYPRYWSERALKAARLKLMERAYQRILQRVEAEGMTAAHEDVAMHRIDDEDLDKLRLFTETSGAADFVQSIKRKRASRQGQARPPVEARVQ